jgi:hypothetical protein
MVCRNAEGVGFSTKDLSMIRYKAHIVFILCFVALVGFSTVSLRAQFSGGSGRGDAVTTVSSLELSGISTTAMYKGGSGRGDVVSSVGPTTFVDWTDGENNRVVTRARFNIAVADTVFKVDTSTANVGYGAGSLRTINQSVLATYSVIPANAGMLSAGLVKPANQLLIKGDFRSISIATVAGQTACVTQGSYPQLLWLDRDRLTVGLTKCYTNKTLTTTYTAGNGSDWYNIRGGGAIKVDATGTITAVSCGEGMVLHLDAANSASYPGTGTTWTDLTGNGNNATLVNTSYNSSNSGTVDFNGTTAYAQINDATTLGMTGELTLSVWYYTGSNLGGDRDVIYLKGRTDVDNYNPFLRVDGAYSWTGPGGRSVFSPNAGIITTNTWYNITITHSSGSLPVVYRNGVNVNSSYTLSFGPSTLPLAVNANPVGISRDIPRGLQSVFNGRIGVIQLYNRALNSFEVLNYFNATKDRYGL